MKLLRLNGADSLKIEYFLFATVVFVHMCLQAWIAMVAMAKDGFTEQIACPPCPLHWCISICEVRVPAPVLYATKLAKMIGSVVQKAQGAADVKSGNLKQKQRHKICNKLLNVFNAEHSSNSK